MKVFNLFGGVYKAPKKCPAGPDHPGGEGKLAYNTQKAPLGDGPEGQELGDEVNDLVQAGLVNGQGPGGSINGNTQKLDLS